MNTSRLCRTRSRGFSLPEVLLATLFISIAFFAFAALQQRLIYSSMKTEGRNAPREAARSLLMQTQIAVQRGASPDLEQVKNVNPGLYELRAVKKWADASAARAGGTTEEQSYIFETYATHKRVAGWKLD